MPLGLSDGCFLLTKTQRMNKEITIGTFSACTSIFLADTINTMIPWLIAMFAVIACDLIAGVRKSLKLGVHVSPSRAVRETMGKMVTYFAWVVMACMIEAAAEHSMSIAMWACLLVCAIEGISIIGNILKPHGYDMSLKGGIALVLGQIFRGSAGEVSDIVEEDHLDIIKARERKKWSDIDKDKVKREKK